MKKAPTLICCATAMLLAVGLSVAAEATLRVGTFDSRGVALAYGRSARPDCMLAKVAELKNEHARAEEKGDRDRAKELEAKATAMQERIHNQVFGGAPIDEILALIEDDLPGIAEAADVDLIISGVLHSGPDVELVDVTEQICAPFEPDADTREMIEKILTTKPVDPARLSHDH
jgi:hypothetical protein